MAAKTSPYDGMSMAEIASRMYLLCSELPGVLQPYVVDYPKLKNASDVLRELGTNGMPDPIINNSSDLRIYVLEKILEDRSSPLNCPQVLDIVRELHNLSRAYAKGLGRPAW